MDRRRILLASLLLVAVALGGCDNIGSIWDPDKSGGPGTGPEGLGTAVQAPMAGSISRSGRPQVDGVFPTGAGWPATVPVVVVFNESINRDTVQPPTGSEDPVALFVRDVASMATVPVTYDFLVGDTVVLMRPLAPLMSPTGEGFEIVVDPALRDADGVTYSSGEEEVIGAFLPDEDASVEDGRIVTTLPLDNDRDIPRERSAWAVFDRPANESSLLTSNLQLRPAGGSALAGDVSFPVEFAGQPDTRVARFDPDAALAGDVSHEIVVNSTITFGTNGQLDFSNRTPFADFRTLSFADVTGVTVGNVMTGFEDKVNRNNIDNLQLDVTVDASAGAGDTVVARIYGLDPETANVSADVNFEERTAQLGVAGAQTVTVSFAGALGTADSPRFDDGSLTIAAYLSRGSSARTGYVLSRPINQPAQDTLLPDFTGAGPPTGTNDTDLITDQEAVAFWGRASEEIGAATLTVGAQMATMFGADSSGGFVMTPIALLFATEPQTYTLSITDAVGNMATTAFTGSIIPRGVVRGDVTGGTLVVEAYDDVTLAAIPGATVFIEPGLPTAGSSGRMSAVTGSDGRATFTGLSMPSYSVTIVADGFDLRSLLDTTAAFASLPLRPTSAATATLAGTLGFLPSAGGSAIVGSNLIDDALEEDVQSSTTSPTTIPATAIRPNRMQVLTAFGGTFEPVGVPAFSNHVCQMCGPTGAAPNPPTAPTAPGDTTSQTLVLTPITLTTANIASAYMVDFTTAGGLDAANLTAAPTVRVVSGLLGFAGMTVFGVGFAQLDTMSTATYTVNATYSLTQTTTLSPFNISPTAPVLYVSTEAADTSGNVSRHRRVLDANLTTTFELAGVMGIPTLTAGGMSTDSPQVTFEDRLDGASLIVSIGFQEIIATDAAGRNWRLLRGDTNGAVGATAIQLPQMAGTGVTGLATGTWTVRTESHVVGTVTNSAVQYLIEEIRHAQIGWARAQSTTFTVN